MCERYFEALFHSQATLTRIRGIAEPSQVLQILSSNKNEFASLRGDLTGSNEM
jgi:hypothetical protein